MFGENWEIAIRIVDAGMVMVRHGDGKCDIDLCALGSQDEAVDEGVVGLFVGAQEESSLGASAGNHVVMAGHDLARKGHAWVFGNGSRKVA